MNTAPVIQFRCEGGNPVEKDGDSCEVDKCQSCCPHDERDYGICMDCEHEQCPGELIDAAEWAFDSER